MRRTLQCGLLLAMLSVQSAHAFAPACIYGAFRPSAAHAVWARASGRVTTVNLAVGMESAGEKDPDEMKAKKNALAANRLQWGISGVPPTPGAATPAGTPAVPAAAPGAAPDVLAAATSGSAATGTGPREGRLGAELELLVQQAREKAALRTDVGVAEARQGAQKSASSQRLQLPGFQLSSLGFKGRWEEVGASYMLYPPKGVEPKAVVHFLGGAFVGAAPHMSYRYMLEEISDNGYIIITTPYNLIFDYVETCASIVQDSSQARARVLEHLPVFGLGHSCGALLQTLLPAFFPDESPRVANALVSWNNKPASDAIPQFEEVIIPFVNALLDENSLAKDIRQNLVRSFQQADEVVTEIAASQFAPLSVQTELLPLTRQGLKIVEQIPELLDIVNAGQREFVPTVSKCAELVRGLYAVPASLVVSFQDDSIDESDKVESLLRLATSADGAAARVTRARLKGSHVTPCTQDVFISTPLDSFDPLLPLRRLARQELLRPINDLNKKIIPFLNDALANYKK